MQGVHLPHLPRSPPSRQLGDPPPLHSHRAATPRPQQTLLRLLWWAHWRGGQANPFILSPVRRPCETLRPALRHAAVQSGATRHCTGHQHPNRKSRGSFPISPIPGASARHLDGTATGSDSADLLTPPRRLLACLGLRPEDQGQARPHSALERRADTKFNYLAPVR